MHAHAYRDTQICTHAHTHLYDSFVLQIISVWLLFFVVFLIETNVVRWIPLINDQFSVFPGWLAENVRASVFLPIEFTPYHFLG